MSGYAGSEAQIALMRRSDDHAEWTRETRGACNVGRMLGCDDIEGIGWPAIIDALKRDGSFGFHLLSLDAATAAAAELQRHGYRLDLWDVFVADRAEPAGQVDRILSAGLPPEMSWLDLGADPEGAATKSVQSFMLANGVVLLNDAVRGLMTAHMDRGNGKGNSANCLLRFPNEIRNLGRQLGSHQPPQVTPGQRPLIAR